MGDIRLTLTHPDLPGHKYQTSMSAEYFTDRASYSTMTAALYDMVFWKVFGESPLMYELKKKSIDG